MTSINTFGAANTYGDRETRAQEAYEKRNDGKHMLAKYYTIQQKVESGSGHSCKCLIFNGTGEPITFVGSHEWEGGIFGSYPQVILNGQWCSFLHTKRALVPKGSEAAVVYRGKGVSGENCDFLFAWSVAFNTLVYSNRAYTKIGKVGEFSNWEAIRRDLEQSGPKVNCAILEGCMSTVSIDSGISPYFIGMLSLETARKVGEHKITFETQD